jgi:hypothetical protein
MVELSDEEHKAIASFKRLEKKWPDTLWLFSGGQSGIAVLKKGPDGEKVTTGFGESFDSDYVVAHIDIEADGGDW